MSDIKVLIADDDPGVVNSLRTLLSLEGYEIFTAGDGQSAINVLGEETLDLVLLDLRMPHRDGLEILEFIGSRCPRTTVIVISGEATVDAAIGALRRGAYDFLRKPYAPEQLLRVVENALRKQRLERENESMATQLRDSEKLHRYLVESSPDLIYMLDEKGNFSLVNERVESLLGWQKDELLGRHYSVLVHPDDLEYAKYVFDERRTGDRASRNVELRLLSRNSWQGERHFQHYTVPIELSSTGVYDAGSAPSANCFKGTYGVGRDITDRKEAEKIISFQASHDLLTRLPNRFLFKDRVGLAIAQARRNNESFAVMFMDVDRFKRINDTLGHLVGDELLQVVGQRARSCLREGDTLARGGGDEYLLLLPQTGSKAGVSTVAEKILAALRKPLYLDGHELFLSATIGIALYPMHGESADSLIRMADIAMYRRKVQGKNGYSFYHESMNTLLSDHLTLETGLRKAISEGELSLYYQPQFNVQTGAIVAMEALLRWQHPERGLLAPVEFIPVAEESGLILPVGAWVLRSACRQLKAWREAGLPDVRMSVNFSALQFEQGNLAEEVMNILEEFDLPGSAIEVEITENIIMKDMKRTVRHLRKLSAHGVRIAIDDFGTGYASLSYLRRLPIDTLKLDRSFVRDIQYNNTGMPIVSAIVSMARSLDLNLVAEGVENEYQLSCLRSLGCHEIQGFLFSKPVPGEQATQLLSGDVSVAIH